MEKAQEEMRKYMPERIAANTGALHKLKTFTALLSGIIAGITGISGLLGFLFFLGVSSLASVYIFVVVTKFSPKTYFKDGLSDIFGFGSLTNGALTFILSWTIVYNSIYIF